MKKEEQKKFTGNPIGGILIYTLILLFVTVIYALLGILIVGIVKFSWDLVAHILSYLSIDLPIGIGWVLGFIALIIADIAMCYISAGEAVSFISWTYAQAYSKWFYIYSWVLIGVFAFALLPFGYQAFFGASSAGGLESFLGENGLMMQWINTILEPLKNCLLQLGGDGEGFLKSICVSLGEDITTPFYLYLIAGIIGLALGLIAFSADACSNCGRAFVFVRDKVIQGASYKRMEFEEEKGHWEQRKMHMSGSYGNDSGVINSGPSGKIDGDITHDVYIPGRTKYKGIYKYTDKTTVMKCMCCGRTYDSRSTTKERIL